MQIPERRRVALAAVLVTFRRQCSRRRRWCPKDRQGARRLYRRCSGHRDRGRAQRSSLVVLQRRHWLPRGIMVRMRRAPLVICSSWPPPFVVHRRLSCGCFPHRRAASVPMVGRLRHQHRRAPPPQRRVAMAMRPMSMPLVVRLARCFNLSNVGIHQRYLSLKTMRSTPRGVSRRVSGSWRASNVGWS